MLPKAHVPFIMVGLDANDAEFAHAAHTSQRVRPTVGQVTDENKTVLRRVLDDAKKFIEFFEATVDCRRYK